MATISELNVRLGLITRDFDRNLGKVERQLRTSAGRLSRLGSDLTVAISAPLAAFGASSIKAAGDTEALTLALQAQLGSAQAARVELEALRKEALKPGLGFEQAVRGSVSLQAVGLTAEDARKTVSNFGNALALAGKGKAELDGVVLALTQISAKGKVSAEEINQLAERLPQIRTLMKQAFGTADTEALQKLGLTSRQFIDGINRELEKLPQATGGIKNSIENVGDSINQFLAGIGNEINNAFNLKQVGEDIAQGLGEALKWFQNLDDSTKRLIVQTGLAVVAIGPLVKVFGALYGAAAQSASVFKSVAGTVSNISKYFGQFSAATGTASTAYDALSRAIRLANINKPILEAASAGTTAANAIRGMGAASTASVAEAGRFKDVARKFIAPIGEEAGRAAVSAFKLRAAILAATGGLAVVVLGIASAIYLMSDRFNAAEFAAKQFEQAAQGVREESAKEVGQLNKNIDVLKDVRSSTDDRKAAANELLRLYPDYLKGIDLESAGLDRLNSIQKELTGNIIRGVAERKKSQAINAIYEKQAEILLRIQEIRRTGDTTTGEATLINTGDMIRAGGIAEAVIQKLQQQVSDLGQQANVTASDFDKAFGLQTRAIDPMLQAQYDARQAAEDSRDAFLGYGDAVKKSTDNTTQFTRAASGAGDGLSKKMRTALASVTAGLTAFDEKVKLYGPSAETAEQKNKLLAASIDKLLKAGFTATSDQVQKLKDELASSSQITEDAKKKYLELRAAWEKPVDVKVPQQAFASLPQANPLGVGGQPSSNSPSADPIDTVSIDQVTEGLISINSLSAAATNQFNSFVAASQKGFGGIQQAASDFYQYWGNTINNVYGAASQLGQNLVALEQANSSAKIKTLEGEYAKRIAAAEGDSARQEALQAELNAKKEALQKKAAKNAKRLAIITAIIDTAQGVTKALGSAPPPINFIMAGLTAAAGAIQIATIKAQPLAKGGVANSPTLALVGEYPGANSNPEIIAPENKLRSIFRQEQGGNMEISTRISGSDLLILLERAGNKTKRTRGY